MCCRRIVWASLVPSGDSRREQERQPARAIPLLDVLSVEPGNLSERRRSEVTAFCRFASLVAHLAGVGQDFLAPAARLVGLNIDDLLASSRNVRGTYAAFLAIAPSPLVS